MWSARARFRLEWTASVDFTAEDNYIIVKTFDLPVLSLT